MDKVEISGIRRMFDLARTLKDPFDFSLGQPDFDVPAEIKSAAARAITDGANRYTPSQGLEETRQAVARYLQKRYGFSVDTSNVIITTGSTGGLYLAHMCLVDEGDEVLIPDPYFVLYPHLVNLSRGTPVFIDTYPTRFRLTPQLIERHITPRSRMLVLNNPVNPTGIAYTSDEIKAIAAVARKHDLLVLADEVYNHFTYDFKHESLYPHHPHTVLVGALSKTFGMPGWRIGYAVAPAPIIEKMIVLQQFTYVCAPSVPQKVVGAALALNMDPLTVQAYRKKRDLAVETLRGAFEFETPQGAFYLFPKAPGGDADAFVKRALDKGIVIVPGQTGSQKRSHFRLSFALPDSRLVQGLKLLRSIA
ncbi:MAG TPA: aminotransferase class I/II-fold pyridoxal phosphate-dependent enzyme [Planctomycetota bacterium]|nr:aminotransferase class I/II-fold pyridoxal phosphate-dependent enzyme [Planctomycetota bacterium]